MEIKDMNMKEIEARMAEIAKELDSPEADIDALEAEVRSLNARKEELNKKAEKRTALLKSVEENGVVVRSLRNMEGEKVEERFDRSSKEYKTAWLKNLAVRNGERIFGELTEIEKRAFMFTTANTGSVVPTDVMNRIVELVKSESPILEDARKSELSRGFGVPRHKEIKTGDAKTVAEGAANDDEEDLFDLLPLDGCEIKKHIVLTRKMKFQSIEAFEKWLTEHLAERIRVAKEKLIIARLDGTAPAGGSVVSEAAIDPANVLTNQTYNDATIRKIFGLLDASGEKVVYANNYTIWNHIAGMENEKGDKLFIPNSMSDPIVQGRIYGATVKEDSNLADNVVYTIVKGQILANDFDELEIFSAIEPKTANTVETAYSLFDAGLENPKGAVKATFTVA